MSFTFIVLVGPPGSGKSTLGRELSQTVHLPYISMGDILRGIGDASTVTGSLAPDEFVCQLAISELEKPVCDRGAILDGWPRNAAQMNDLEKWRPFGAGILYVSLVADDRILRDRMSRRLAKESRPDDDEATIGNRLQVFREETLPLIEKAEWPVLEIDASGSGEDTLHAVLGGLGEHLMDVWLTGNAFVLEIAGSTN